MDGTLLAQGVVGDGAQRAHGSRVVYANLLGHVVHTVDGSIPYNVIDGDVVTDEGLNVVVDVDDTYQSVTVLTEIITEGGVLTEGVIAVVGEIGG